jgi:hypothetical protein
MLFVLLTTTCFAGMSGLGLNVEEVITLSLHVSLNMGSEGAEEERESFAY